MDAIMNSGGRITRSLRKRLTSVDSDAANRPETPNQISKLQSISELDKICSSPTRSSARLTRNNSVSNITTPAKTPGRRSNLALAQQTPENTPNKRLTRRRSTSNTEDDVLQHPTIRKPEFDALAEEEKSPSQKLQDISKISSAKLSEQRRRVGRTRLAGKPIDQLKKTEESSDVEVVVVNDCDSSSNENSSTGIERQPTIKLEKVSMQSGNKELTTEKDNESKNGNEIEIENKNSTCLADNTEQHQEPLLKESEIKVEDLTRDSEEEGNLTSISDGMLISNSFIKTKAERDDENNMNSNTSAASTILNADVAKDKNVFETNSTEFNGTLVNSNVSDEHATKIQNTSNTKDLTNDNLDDSYNLKTQNSFKNKSNNRKSVTFEGNAMEEMEKSTYPKTPSLPKHKNISGEQNFSTDDDNSFESVELMTGDKIQHSPDKTELNADENNGLSSVTPLKKVNSCGNSTPIIAVDSNMEEIIPTSSLAEFEIPISNEGDLGSIHEDQEESQSTHSQSFNNNVKEVKESNSSFSFAYNQKDNLKTPPQTSNTTSPMQTASPMIQEAVEKSANHSLQWIEPKSAGRLSEVSKFDAISKPSDDNKENSISNNNNEETSSDEENIVEENDDRQDDSESSDSKPNKNDFISECEVVDNYESGDSMDSDERQALLENDMLERGESIGSNTTEENSLEDEDADENDSFIVSDDEIEQFLLDDSDDGFEEDFENLPSKIDKEDEENIVGKSAKSVAIGEILIDEGDIDNHKELHTFDKSSDNLDPDKIEISQEPNEINKKYNTLSHSDVRIQMSNSESQIEDNVLNDNNYEDVKDKEDDEDKDDEEEDKEDEAEQGKEEGAEEADREEGEGGDNKEYVQEPQNSPKTDINELEIYELKEGGSPIMKKNMDKNESIASLKFMKTNAINRQKKKRLSLSFSCFNKTEDDDEQNLMDTPLHRSFNIEVSVKDSKAESSSILPLNSNSVKDLQLEVEGNIRTISEDMEEEENNSEAEFEKQQLEKLQHYLPLGNPLVRSRRQSLAFPNNPDKHISEMNKEVKRKSLGVTDFKPSQSFITSLEAQKQELQKQSLKRKRLSKSFGGINDADTGIDVDVDYQKCSKIDINSTANAEPNDSIEDTENKKSITKSTKIVCSSTPYRETLSIASQVNNTYERIISRCDEILEKVNRAKLESKAKNKKKKVKRLRKSKLTKRQGGVDKDNGGIRLEVEKEEVAENRKGQNEAKNAGKEGGKATKLSKNIKPKKDLVVNPPMKRRILCNDGANGKNDNITKSKRLPSNLLEEVAKSQKKTGKTTKGIATNLITKNECTSAGDIVEMPATPKKAKIAKKFILPTGVISEEPITPKGTYSSVGMAFEERPSTPKSAGFKAMESIGTTCLSSQSNQQQKQAKRKRYNLESSQPQQKQAKRKRRDLEEAAEFKLRKPQWSKSGTFYVENIPLVYELSTTGSGGGGTKFSVCSLQGKRKIRLAAGEHPLDALNFKKNALMRSDIKRISTRELLQRKERLKY